MDNKIVEMAQTYSMRERESSRKEILKQVQDDTSRSFESLFLKNQSPEVRHAEQRGLRMEWNAFQFLHRKPSGIVRVGTVVSASQKAFTLAEVLITLAIIGVVAALTIPTVVKNYQKQQTVVKVKKVYSSLQQMISSAKVDYGDVDSWNWNLNGQSFAAKYFVPYLKVSKKCRLSKGDCYTNDAVKSTSGVGTWTFDNYHYQVELFDGTVLFFDKVGTSLVQASFDINGKKAPNQSARDFFNLQFYRKGVGNCKNNLCTQYSNYTNEQLKTEKYACKKVNFGGPSCLEYIMRNGWQMPDDYPW